ncbi:MAG: hypothetical protein AB9879_15350 [Methanothrix sp.]
MINIDCSSKSAYSLNTGSFTVEINRDPHILQWQLHSLPAKTASKVGLRLDNRRRKWQKIPASAGSPQSINAVNVYMHYGGCAMSFGPRDPIGIISQRDIKIPKIEAVSTYLKQYPELSELLNKTSKASRQTFGSGAQLSLEIYHDIETNDEYLTLYVRQNKYDPEIMKKIKQIRRTYRSLAKDTKGRFLLTTDFRSPR